MEPGIPAVFVKAMLESIDAGWQPLVLVVEDADHVADPLQHQVDARPEIASQLAHFAAEALVDRVYLLIDCVYLLFDSVYLLFDCVYLLFDCVYLLFDCVYLLFDCVYLLIDYVYLLIDYVYDLLFDCVYLLIDSVYLLIDSVYLLIDYAYDLLFDCVYLLREAGFSGLDLLLESLLRILKVLSCREIVDVHRAILGQTPRAVDPHAEDPPSTIRAEQRRRLIAELSVTRANPSGFRIRIPYPVRQLGHPGWPPIAGGGREIAAHFAPIEAFCPAPDVRNEPGEAT